MYTGSLGTVSNRQDWSQAIDVVDENGDDVTITSASISLAVRKKNDSSPSLEASVGSGITIVSPRFTFAFTDTQMRGLDPGTYDVGCTVEIAGTVDQLIVGTVVVVDGIVT
jgi:hypothetical protein